MEINELLALYRKFENGWIAFSSDETRVLGASQNYEEALNSALKSGESDPLMYKVPSTKYLYSL